MLALIDNYDSFTYNLVHFLGELGAETRVFRNDAITPAEVLALAPEGIVLSPGPCDPDKGGICLELIAAACGKLPILGVCLGHQAIGQDWHWPGRSRRDADPHHNTSMNFLPRGMAAWSLAQPAPGVGTIVLLPLNLMVLAMILTPQVPTEWELPENSTSWSGM